MCGKQLLDVRVSGTILNSNIANKIRSSLKLNRIKIIWSNIDTKSERDQWYGNNAKLKKLGFKEKNSFGCMLDYTVKNIYKVLKEKQFLWKILFLNYVELF